MPALAVTSHWWLDGDR